MLVNESIFVERLRNFLDADNRRIRNLRSEYFQNANSDAVTLDKAPMGVPLIVITSRLGTLWAHDTGTFILRGSILVKVERGVVNCIDCFTRERVSFDEWIVYPSNGLFTFGQGSLYGRVKPLKDVVV